MGKILQRFPRAAIVDAFAGPGEYVGGTDGSPIIIAKLFHEHVLRDNFHDLDLIAQEERPDRVDHLKQRLTMLPQDSR